MIKTNTNTSRWYDVECDAPDCEMMISAEYAQCIGWASPTQAVCAAIDAGWERCEEDGVEQMYCLKHKEPAVTQSWMATCRVCDKSETVETAPAPAYANDYFTHHGWEIKRGANGNWEITCPDCVAKRHM